MVYNFRQKCAATGRGVLHQQLGPAALSLRDCGRFCRGLISDRFFQSRRGPPAALLCGGVLVMALLMEAALFSSPVMVGVTGLFIVLCAIGITSLMSGTAATDFGGRKATATCSGVVDGFAYLGTGLQAVSLGYLTEMSWRWWPVFLVPFAIVGALIAIKIWRELPAATRKYLADQEKKQGADLVSTVTPQ